MGGRDGGEASEGAHAPLEPGRAAAPCVRLERVHLRAVWRHAAGFGVRDGLRIMPRAPPTATTARPPRPVRDEARPGAERSRDLCSVRDGHRGEEAVRVGVPRAADQAARRSARGSRRPITAAPRRSAPRRHGGVLPSALDPRDRREESRARAQAGAAHLVRRASLGSLPWNRPAIEVINCPG
jgi:hypothetical protein